MFKEKLTVKRVINNNIVIAENRNGQELVAIGKGLGFHKNVYDTIFPGEVQKEYVLLNNSSYIFQTLEQVPFEIIELTQKIVDLAQSELQCTFNVNLVVALADHINFTINQFHAGVTVPVLVNEEVRRFYKEEYAIGKMAVKMINEAFNIDLKNEEAGSIAFHLIVATEKRSNHDSVMIMKGVTEIIDIIEEDLQLKLNEESVAYTRFIIHLKYFMRSILFEQVKITDDPISGILSPLEENNTRAARCVEKISEYVLTNYDYSVHKNDRLYLMIHIIRILECS